MTGGGDDPAVAGRSGGPVASFIAGFWGKLPGRGDFVGSGLPEIVIAAFETWSRAAIAASRADLGDLWDERWMSAPIWRFRLGVGVAGDLALAGIWLPSIDSVGRRFPLFIAGDACHVGAVWLEAAERHGFEAVTADLDPRCLASRLSRLADGEGHSVPSPGRSVWWTEGGPYRSAGHLETVMLPSAEMFASMLADDAASDGDAGHGQGVGAA